MACKKNELQEAIEWDDYGTPTQFKCVVASDNKSGGSNGFGGSSWIDWFKVLSGATTSVILATKGQQTIPAGNKPRTYDPTLGGNDKDKEESGEGGINPIWWIVGAVVIGGFLWLITRGNGKK